MNYKLLMEATGAYSEGLNIIDLHLKQGYAFDPGRDYVIEKNGKTILMVCMSLNKNDFKASKLSRLKQNLPTLKWGASPFE